MPGKGVYKREDFTVTVWFLNEVFDKAGYHPAVGSVMKTSRNQFSLARGCLHGKMARKWTMPATVCGYPDFFIKRSGMSNVYNVEVVS